MTARTAIEKLVDWTRTWQIAVLAILLLALLAQLQPQQVGLVIFACAKGMAAVSLGYVADRVVFPASRPDRMLSPQARWHAEYRRVALILGLALAIGVTT